MKRVLGVDIGGTRITASILTNPIDLAQIKAAKVTSVSSVGWLNSSLPRLLAPDEWAGLRSADVGLAPFDRAAIAMPGESVGGLWRCWMNAQGVPADMVGAFTDAARMRVGVCNDGQAWARGAALYRDLLGQPCRLPAAVLTFGTGIGLGVVRPSGRAVGLEISELSNDFINTSRVAGLKVNPAWRVHHVCGRQFFDWLSAERPSWSYHDVREHFTARVAAVLLDIEAGLSAAAGGRVWTLYIAGGNASWVSIRGLRANLGGNVQVEALTDAKLGFSAGLLPILGAVASTEQDW